MPVTFHFFSFSFLCTCSPTFSSFFCVVREEIKAWWKIFLTHWKRKCRDQSPKRARTQSIYSQNRRPVDRPADRHAQHGVQQQFGRPSSRPTVRSKFLLKVDRPFGRLTGTTLVLLGFSRSERSIEGRVCWSYQDSNSVFDSESNPIEIF